MSDDEYYGELDDFEDSLWDADPAPDLADDLAEHTAYSPVWQDDPIGELEAYHSDWDYYSDDYYDDDPLLKTSTLDGSSPKSRILASNGNHKRGRKRKLDEAREPISTIAKGSLADSIKGTVWAKDDCEEVAVYHKGQQKKVSLLRNWRDLFKSDAGETHIFGRGQLHRDESWANDMSLAEMGLLPENGTVMPQEEIAAEGQAVGQVLSGVETENGEDDEEMDRTTEDGVEDQERDNGALRILTGQSRKLSQAGSAQEEDLLPNKRRKTSMLPSPPRSRKLKSHTNYDGSEDQSNPDQILQTITGISAPTLISEHVPQEQLETRLTTVEAKSHENSQARKRKVSFSQEESDQSVADTTGRSKRVASSKLSQDSHTNDTSTVQKRARKTRHGKK